MPIEAMLLTRGLNTSLPAGCIFHPTLKNSNPILDLGNAPIGVLESSNFSLAEIATNLNFD